MVAKCEVVKMGRERHPKSWWEGGGNLLGGERTF
jgi:hypothetical protein